MIPWKRTVFPRNIRPEALSGLSPADIWLVGYRGAKRTRSHPYAAHWDGLRWKTSPTAVGSGGGFVAVAAVSPTEAWAIQTGAVRSAIQRWDGHRWRVVRFLKNRDDLDLEDILAFPGEAWVVGTRSVDDDPNSLAYRLPYLLHGNGKNWRTIDNRLTHTHGGLIAATGLSRRKIWAVGEALIARYGC
jgi:hypothetical protein